MKLCHFVQKMKKKYTERWSRRKNGCKLETLNPVFVVVLHPWHPLSLTKLDSFVDGFYSPHFGGDWVTVNIEKVNKLSAFSLLVFSLCTSFKKKTVV